MIGQRQTGKPLIICRSWQLIEIYLKSGDSAKLHPILLKLKGDCHDKDGKIKYQRTNGPVNAHQISWPSKAQNIQNMENIW